MQTRTEILVAVLVLLSSASLAETTAPSACELLPPTMVCSVAGQIVHLDPATVGDRHADRSMCRYVGEDHTTAFTFSMRSLESDGAARAAFGHELRRIFGASSQSELLRGVGAEARFGMSAQTRDNTIVARYGAIVFVLESHANQEVLVTLARSVVAHLERADPQ